MANIETKSAAPQQSYGRKVFFLDPPYNFVKQNIATLRMLEYEVYIVGDYQNMKNILRIYPDSLLYIYIDSVLPRLAWRNFIVSIQKDAALKHIKIGLFTKGITNSQQDDFLKYADIPGGIILMQGNADNITGAFIDSLEKNDAKGRRKYVRADLQNIKGAQMFMPLDGKMYTFQLMDISSVGCAVKIPKTFPGHIEKNMLIRDCSLQLHHGIHVDMLCFAVKEDADYNQAVFLFIKASNSAKNIIRDYVAILLQKELNDMLEKIKPDDTNYSQPLSKILGVKAADDEAAIEAAGDISDEDISRVFK